MTSVFISHAAVDKPLVDDVKTMIQTAVGLSPTEIFYSSSAGSGIPAGKNFVAHMADRMRGAGFVVAVITPAYLESRFCLAELGAVWYSEDKEFFPLCIAVDYDELTATLTGVQVPRLDARASLTGLLQKICGYARKEHVAEACTEAADSFLATLPSRLRGLQGQTLVAADKLAEVERVRDQLAEQLTSARDELRDARELYEKAKQAKTREEIEALEPPTELREEVERVLEEAEEAVRVVDSTVQKALPYALKGEGMPWPDGGSWERADVQSVVDEGFLEDGEDGYVYVNDKWPKNRLALERLRLAQEVLTALDGDDEEWFIETFEAPPDLAQSAVFSKLM